MYNTCEIITIIKVKNIFITPKSFLVSLYNPFLTLPSIPMGLHVAYISYLSYRVMAKCLGTGQRDVSGSQSILQA